MLKFLSFKTSLSLLLGLFFLSVATAQNLSLKGTVLDTSGNAPLSRATVLLVRISDSTLIKYSRTNEKGFFEIKQAPLDTYQVVIQHPFSSDKEIILIANAENNDFDLGKIALPPKSLNLKEVTILGYKDPIYFKGDTIVFVADSFKVKQNATVEDLLKKLPGIQVDGQGKIKSQGKEVSQVLVDGDEFFGTDPTTATRNLAAGSIESVNVYEKKNENAAAGSADDKITVMDLKLKEDAKKGYFGKVEGGSDFNRFYEGKLLANKFSNKQKISISGLLSNTPNTSFGWEADRYGIEDDSYTREEIDEDNIRYYSNHTNEGFPIAKKAGIYYNNKFSDKTKVNANYSFSEKTVDALKETNSQYFLSDTSYTVKNLARSIQFNRSHNFNIKLEQKLDSLTTLFIEPSFKKQEASNKSVNNSDFVSSNGVLQRSTDIANENSSKSDNFSNKLKLQRNFMKKDRQLILSYFYAQVNNNGNGKLLTLNEFSNGTPDSTIDQQRSNSLIDRSHRASLQYTEPLSKKFKLNLNYELSYSNNQQDKETFNTINGDYTLLDSILSNDFTTTRRNNLVAASLAYETKKHTIRLGTKARNNFANNINLDRDVSIKQNVNNILPFVSYAFKASQTSNLRLAYSTNSTSPSIAQLQPVPNNTNPNFITQGNPNLLPTFEQRLEANFFSYSPLKGNNLWSGATISVTNDGFSNSLNFDSLGRSVSTPINVQGNYFAFAYLGANYNVWDKKIRLNPSINVNTSSNANFINGIKNTSTNQSVSASFGVSLELEKFQAGISGSTTYNNTATTLNNAANRPFYSNNFSGNLEWTLPFKLVVNTDATYFLNSNRADGFNVNYFIWNASLTKKFMSKENLLISIAANDLLNQNISVDRDIQNNAIVDTKTNIIGRYLLFKLTYKFDSNKEKLSEDEF